MDESPRAFVSDSLGVVADALARADETLELASLYLDPSLVDMLSIIGFDRQFVSAEGCHLYDIDGHAYLDLHTGEGFASLGHNHPLVRETLEATLGAKLADGVQIHYSVLAGMLAEALSQRLPSGLDAVFFASTGAEAVDSAMKFARAATGRSRFVSCDSSFHGVTLGPLSLVGDGFFKKGFGPLLPGCRRVPFGDLARLKAALRRRDVAAFIVEPVQGRMVTVAPDGYLQAAQELCHRYGTLFIADEIQTGLGRTGKWFALEHWGLQPDFVLVGKALSGGYMPVAAMVTTREIFQAAVGTLERSYVHQSTYGRNRLSMAAGLASMRVIERDGLVENAAGTGAALRAGLSELASRHEMIREIRGLGLMVGIELGAPSARLAKLNWRLIHLASEGLFPQLVVIPLHRDHRMITMAAGKNDVIKLLPPLTLSQAEVDRFLEAFDAVLRDCGGTGSKNWGVVREIATTTLRRRLSRQRPRLAAAAEFRGRPIEPGRDDACLVTGASGFIGGRLVARLVEEGYQVRCLVRPTSDTSALDRLGVEIAAGDLTDRGSLRRAADGCSHVVHCGALVSDWATTEEITAINVGGTRNLLAAARAASATRLVHFSSTDVYGHPGNREVDEQLVPRGFANWYSETKWTAEADVRQAFERGDLETVILRPATVYGPGSKTVVGEMAQAIRRGNMMLIDRGRTIAGLVYVDNLIDVALLALRHGAAPGHAFNVTDGLDVTWKQFTDDLAAGLGRPPVRWSAPYWAADAVGTALEVSYRSLRKVTRLKTPPLLSRQAVHVLGRDQAFSNRKARELLGWQPRIGYDEGLRATLDWLRREHLS